MYGDIILRHPEIMDLIPKDIIIVDWHYRPSDHYPSIQQFKKPDLIFWFHLAFTTGAKTFPISPRPGSTFPILIMKDICRALWAQSIPVGAITAA